MKSVECTHCGSKEFFTENGFTVCAYCQTNFQPDIQNGPRKGSVIDVAYDIEALLKKCVEDPKNRRRYANLVLDIDPSNLEAIKFLH